MLRDGDEVKVWRYIIIGVVTLLVSVMVSCQTTNYRIVQAIKSGADPIEASCALGDTISNICIIKAVQKGEK